MMFHPPTHSFICSLLVLFAMCSGCSEQATISQDKSLTVTAHNENVITDNRVEYTLKIGMPIFSVAAIPATAHRSKSQIVLAHGDEGVSIRDTSGEVLWVIETPARLVAHYNGHLVVFRQDQSGESTLNRYQLSPTRAPILVDTQSPSPIAATTLQRTSIASLGPVRINGTDLIIGDDIIPTPSPIAAVASASYFPPLISGQTLLIATNDGNLIIRSF